VQLRVLICCSTCRTVLGSCKPLQITNASDSLHERDFIAGIPCGLPGKVYDAVPPPEIACDLPLRLGQNSLDHLLISLHKTMAADESTEFGVMAKMDNEVADQETIEDERNKTVQQQLGGALEVCCSSDLVQSNSCSLYSTEIHQFGPCYQFLFCFTSFMGSSGSYFSIFARQWRSSFNRIW
jgi:hypothetical protein